MTTDPFTEAARAEAERQYPALNPDAEKLTYPRSALREHKRSAHIAGWEAARTHLAAQEPTDAELDALYDAFMAGKATHSGQPELTSAMEGSMKRTLLDSWALSRKRSEVDITAFTGATLALYGASLKKVKSPRFGRRGQRRVSVA